MRICPGTTDSAGNPPTEASQTPGVVSRKLNVVKNMTTANALPTRAARTESGRAAISKPITISVDQTIGEAAAIMLNNKVSGLPVLNKEGQLVGIITESDIFRMVVKNWSVCET